MNGWMKKTAIGRAVTFRLPTRPHHTVTLEPFLNLREIANELFAPVGHSFRVDQDTSV
jgi:hypothetical protein